MLLALLVYILRFTHCINCELIKLSENSMHIVLHTQKNNAVQIQAGPRVQILIQSQHEWPYNNVCIYCFCAYVIDFEQEFVPSGNTRTKL